MIRKLRTIMVNEVKDRSRDLRLPPLPVEMQASLVSSSVVAFQGSVKIAIARCEAERRKERQAFSLDFYANCLSKSDLCCLSGKREVHFPFAIRQALTKTVSRRRSSFELLRVD